MWRKSTATHNNNSVQVGMKERKKKLIASISNNVVFIVVVTTSRSQAIKLNSKNQSDGQTHLVFNDNDDHDGMELKLQLPPTNNN